MKNILIILNSTIFMVLFCFPDLYSLPLTRSCYISPEDKIDMSLKEEFVYIENLNRKDSYSFNLGLKNDTSAGFDFSVINNSYSDFKGNTPGDILFNIWHFTGDYSGGIINTGLSIVIRIPTGPDVYSDEKFRNLSFGNNELKLSPVVSFNLADHQMLILNLSYTFRESKNQDFYDGFKINPMKGDTYKSCFGLNPFYHDAFLSGQNLKNDYASISAGVVTSAYFPWILFSEIYYSSGFYRGNNAPAHMNIEGDGVKPLLVSAGIKYFFSDSFYIQLSDIVNLLKNDRYIKNTLEFSMNIFF